ncbi:UNVERIFIED_CONTAM: hypothetical protein Slati_3968800 [Sesamum latifolium]|uniref:Uncharacterized protein n=1 Tax=Sesamum latifolium TaxID=2727402 RepID=A0AAW2TQ23_9LAMI
MSSSNSLSSSASTSGSSATSPRPVNVPAPPVGPPKVRIPRKFDRMHRPPHGFCPFSLVHFEAGFRLPLTIPVARILQGLDICPMQLSPNSISHIMLFIIIMLVNNYEPNFDNFWSLYSFTTSKRSGDRGFFYLSTRKDCRFLDTLKSNVGPWKEKFIFIRPPPNQEWPFRVDWNLDKPEPITEGGGLEGNQINHLTSSWYKLKKLLEEKVLCLAGLSPAPLRVRDDVVMNARIAGRLRALRNAVPRIEPAATASGLKVRVLHPLPL